MDDSFDPLRHQHGEPDEEGLPSSETTPDPDEIDFGAASDADETIARRIPDFTIFSYRHNEVNRPFYPVIVLENKPWPFTLPTIATSPTAIYQVHSSEVYRIRAASCIVATRQQAQQQLQAIFHEYGGIKQVTYVYAIGGYFCAYEVTREMVDASRVPPMVCPDINDIHYLFQDPRQSVGSPSSTSTSVNWRLNEELIRLWTTAANRDD